MMLKEMKKKLNKITEKIFHRGPDNTGYCGSEKDKVFIGHSRLSIIDLSLNASQPMVSLIIDKNDFNVKFIL